MKGGIFAIASCGGTQVGGPETHFTPQNPGSGAIAGNAWLRNKLFGKNWHHYMKAILAPAIGAVDKLSIRAFALGGLEDLASIPPNLCHFRGGVSPGSRLRYTYRKMTVNDVTELPLPQPIGAILAAWFILAFLAFFAWMAVGNLLAGEQIVPSLVWLGLNVLVVGTGCHVEGPRGFLLDILGAFTTRHFFKICPNPGHPTLLRIGFRLLGVSLSRWILPLDSVKHLSWSPGQGTVVSGCDVHDWTVTLWFQPDTSETTRKSGRFPGLEVIILGPPSSRDVAATLGRTIIGLLEEAGACLNEEGSEGTGSMLEKAGLEA